MRNAEIKDHSLLIAPGGRVVNNKEHNIGTNKPHTAQQPVSFSPQKVTTVRKK